ncbi:MAG: signal recognition particle-docking protein FtsY [Burkholderiales bacterium]|nr:signal recognition particle-docking protein FtsY [Burkholderiales bacterium]
MVSFFGKSSAPPAPGAVDTAPAPATGGWRDRLRAGLSRVSGALGEALGSVVHGRRTIDSTVYDDLEAALLAADVGIGATQDLLEALRKTVARDALQDVDALREALRDALLQRLQVLEQPLDTSAHRPFIVMVAGVNGSGKTTSIGKLARWFQTQGKKPLLAAGDTFRAAAREQLKIWGQRNGIDVIAQDSGDPAAVVFDAINAGRARGADVVIADTAGRLPTQLHLMDELAKVRRVIAKADASGPHEVLLVIDAHIGQNSLAQIAAFDKAVGVTGLVVTKLDGTAKAGVLVALACSARPLPVRFIGVGEGLDDLQPFSARDFVEALLP